MKFVVACLLGYTSAATFELPTFSYDEESLEAAKSEIDEYIPKKQAAEAATMEELAEDLGKALSFGYAYDVTHYAKAVKPYVNAMGKEIDAITFSDSCDTEALGKCVFDAVTADLNGMPFDKEGCAKAAGCTCPWMENPAQVEAEIWEAYGDAYENEQEIK